MRVVVAPDKFRGTLSAAQAADVLARALMARGVEAIEAPMSDGGDGLLDVLGGPNRTTTVSGPLGDPVDAPWRYGSRTAVIEMAQASGLAVIGGAEHNDPVAASSRGTGELIRAALEAGARRIVVGLGGSASTDGGLGALDAIGSLQRLRGIRLEVACDVRTSFLDAAEVFAPQKGATPAQVELLRRRLVRLAQVYADEHGVEVVGVEHTGAAGGLAGGLLCVGATLVPGAELVAEMIGLDEAIEGADLVITGEGRLDTTSYEGKVVGSVSEMAAAAGVGTVAIVGSIGDVDEPDADSGGPGPVEVVSLVDLVGNEAAFDNPAAALEAAAQTVLERFA